MKLFSILENRCNLAWADSILNLKLVTINMHLLTLPSNSNTYMKESINLRDGLHMHPSSKDNRLTLLNLNSRLSACNSSLCKNQAIKVHNKKTRLIRGCLLNFLSYSINLTLFPPTDPSSNQDSVTKLTSAKTTQSSLQVAGLTVPTPSSTMTSNRMISYSLRNPQRTLLRIRKAASTMWRLLLKKFQP